MFIQNGDIVIMSGKTLICVNAKYEVKIAIINDSLILGPTRLNYHAVPRIIPNLKFNIDGNHINYLVFK